MPEREPAKRQAKSQIVARALSAICSALAADAEEKGVLFNQRPFFRLFLCLLMDLNGSGCRIPARESRKH